MTFPSYTVILLGFSQSFPNTNNNQLFSVYSFIGCSFGESRAPEQGWKTFSDPFVGLFLRLLFYWELCKAGQQLAPGCTVWLPGRGSADMLSLPYKVSLPEGYKLQRKAMGDVWGVWSVRITIKVYPHVDRDRITQRLDTVDRARVKDSWYRNMYCAILTVIVERS